MAAQTNNPVPEKPQAEEHIEETKRLEHDGVFDARDQFGAHSKVDPAEIKLVKKLDWYIMVSAPFPLSFLMLTKPAHTLGGLFPQLLRPQRNCERQAQWAERRARPRRKPIQHPQ